MKKVVIHDLDPVRIHRTIPAGSDTVFIDAAEKAAPCTGCFGCWLVTPGICVTGDALRRIGIALAASDEVLVISRNLYGGYSPCVKRVFDRSIGALLPFFTYRNGRIHHPRRYRNQPVLSVYFYGTITAFERSIAEELIAANAVNLGARLGRVSFFKSPERLLEELPAYLNVF